MHVCPRCQRDRLVKNGSAAGKPKKQCKQCGHQCTRTTPRGKPLSMKINAVLRYLSGVSMNRIAFLFRISAQAALTWIRALAQQYQEKPEPPCLTGGPTACPLWQPQRPDPPPCDGTCPGRAAPLSAVRPCAPAGLSQRAGGAARAGGTAWPAAGGAREGPAQKGL